MDGAMNVPEADEGKLVRSNQERPLGRGES
jgi:hypothetical protein